MVEESFYISQELFIRAIYGQEINLESKSQIWDYFDKGRRSYGFISVKILFWATIEKNKYLAIKKRKEIRIGDIENNLKKLEGSS